MWRLIFSLLLAFAAWGQTSHPILGVGSPAPDFSLPGVDGKTHRLADYAASPVLIAAASRFSPKPWQPSRPPIRLPMVPMRGAIPSHTLAAVKESRGSPASLDTAA